MKGTFVAVIHPRENGNGYECRVPDMPGCITSGKTIFEAYEMIEDAANLWSCDIEIDGREIPVATPYEEIEHLPGDILQVIHVDSAAYLNMTDNKAVRKNVSLPAWMAKQADRRGLNCSQLLQKAILKELKLA